MATKKKYNLGWDEYVTFSAALKKVLTVSHAEMKTRIEKRKAKKPSVNALHEG